MLWAEHLSKLCCQQMPRSSLAGCLVDMLMGAEHH